jgi:hypothetical protein
MIDTDDLTLSIYEWFKKAISSTGYRMSTPRCSDIRKTYQYRAVQKFVKKALDIGLNKDQMQVFIKKIVEYAKNKRLIYRGTALLNMADIFNICYNGIASDVDKVERQIDSIQSSVHLIYQPLAESKELGGYSNLTCLIDSGELPTIMLAVSKRCALALRRISHSERMQFPSDQDLLKTRVKLLIDKNNYNRLKKILGEDLLDVGVPL